MAVFAHKNDKSKFNLGNESDLSGIGDGTTFNAIKTINGLLGNKQNSTDNSLNTSSKTVVGAINELKSGVDNRYTKAQVDSALGSKQNSTDNSLQTSSKTIVGAINELRGATVKTLFNQVINQTTNVLFEANSMYLIFYGQNVNGNISSIGIAYEHTNANTVNPWIELVGNVGNVFSNLPSSGLLQGLYPKSGYYIQVCIIKIN